MSVSEIKLSKRRQIQSVELSVEDCFMPLSQLDAEKNYVKILPNGVIVVFSDEGNANISLIGKNKCALYDIQYVSARLNGYVLLGINDEETLLLSPKGNLRAKYSYQKDLLCKAIKEKKNGIDCYRSGFMLCNKFFLNYGMIALKCQNKCFLSRINKLDFSNIFCVGIYNDIKTILDNSEGLVYVLYHNGTAKLFDKTFKEIKIDGLKEVIFLENGDFFGVTNRGFCLYDKNAKLIKILNSVQVKNYARFYKVENKTFDCFTHKEVLAEGDVLFLKNNVEVFYKDEKVSIKKTKKKGGVNTIEITDILFNVKEKPLVVDKNFIVIKSCKHMLIYDWTLSKDEMKHKIFGFVKNLTIDDDLSIEVFDYLKSLCSYLTNKNNMLLKNMFLERMIAI